MTTVCFTGHRPDKLGGYDWFNKDNITILANLYSIIDELVTKRGVTRFYFGGALGIDQMAFAVAYKYKESNNANIELCLALPYANQYKKWFPQDVARWQLQKKQADKVIYVDEEQGYQYNRVAVGEHHNSKLELRNHYIVDNSEIVVALWNGSDGGTANCIDYAREKHKEIIMRSPLGDD